MMEKDGAIIVTGATRGIGRALAQKLSREGRRVYGAGRTWRDDESTPFTKIIMNVTRDDSVEAGVRRVLDECGRIDALVANAGIGFCGPVEDSSIEAAQDVFSTNYFGMVRVIRAVLPAMREARRGTIACVSSASGKIGIPFQSHYAASKFAAEGFAESLYHELKPLGIRVLLVEPGDVGTAIWKNTNKGIAARPEYRAPLDRFLAVKEREMGSAADAPEAVAAAIARIIGSRSRKFRHPVARGASFILTARKILPDALFLRLVARNYLGS